MINWKKFKPILVVPSIPTEDGIRFLCQDQQLDINGEIVPILWKILSLCNGYRTLDEIFDESKIEYDLIKDILSELNEQNLIFDACEQYKYFHSISSYPAKYLQLLSEEEVINHKKSQRKEVKKGKSLSFNNDQESCLYKLQLNRKSCRNFSKDRKLSLNQLGNICNYAYSLKRHATPSGGALYPLKIFCIVTQNQKDFDSGYYEYDNENDKLVLYNCNPDNEQLKYCYNDEKLAFNSSIQIVICADFERQAYKYSNRGYRLSLIEAGQVAQNISLYCEEKGLSTCELGGLLDIPLAKELDIYDSNIYPVLGIAIGYSDSKENFSYSQFLSKLTNEFVGENKPIKSFGINYLNIFDSSFYGAWAKYGNDSKRIAGATALSYNESICKAIIEGYERYRSEKVRIDYVGECQNSKRYFNPDDIAPLSSKQRILWGLKNYTFGDKIEWTKDITGKYYIPTDFVFYGHNKKEKLFLSDSSGIAAYSDYETAKKRALLELIERDAIIRNWYNQISAPKVNPDIVSQHIKNRIEYWKNKGRTIHIMDLDSISASVFLVVIVSDEYPCFVSGSSAVIDTADSAMLKALQEAEYNLLLAIENPFENAPEIDKIKTPQDHGRYYHFLENADKISWLWKSKLISDKQIKKITDLSKAIDELDTVFVDLSDKDSSIKVVRAVSRKLVPISFGYHRDYYLHHILQENGFDEKIRNLPHYFA